MGERGMSPLPPRARDTLGCAYGMSREGVDVRVATCMSRRQPTGRLVVWPLRVCAPVHLVCLKMPCGFSPLSHEQKGEMGTSCAGLFSLFQVFLFGLVPHRHLSL